MLISAETILEDKGRKTFIVKEPLLIVEEVFCILGKLKVWRGRWLMSAIHIALLGLGTVGKGVLETIETHQGQITVSTRETCENFSYSCEKFRQACVRR